MIVDLVNRHARLSVLAAFEEAVRVGGITDLRTIAAELIYGCARQPSVRIAAADWAIAGTPFDYTEALSSGGVLQKLFPKPFALLPTNELARIIGAKKDTVVADLSVVYRAWEAALETLGLPQNQRFAPLLEGVELIAGIESGWGEICSFSNPKFPGFIAFGVHSPPAIIAEQVIHEAVHINLAATLLLNEELADLRKDDLGVLSPFTNSVRTVERLVHGLVSYSAVLAFWRDLAASTRAENALEVTSEEAERICRQRIELLAARIQVGLLSLRDAGGQWLVSMVQNTAEDELGIPLPQESSISRSKVVALSDVATDPTTLSPIQRAEVMLAALGHKVSRISTSLRSSGAVGFSIMKQAAVVGSPYAVNEVRDSRLGGFSNVASNEQCVLDAPPDFAVHLYVSKDAELARAAAIRDKTNEADVLFQIPACCSNAFKSRWSTVANAGGDLFADMLRRNQSSGTVMVARECDVSALYRGEGLCWHFPCSPTCSATIQIVRERQRIVEATDAELLSELTKTKPSTIRLNSEGGYEVLGDKSSSDFILFLVQELSACRENRSTAAAT